MINKNFELLPKFGAFIFGLLIISAVLQLIEIDFMRHKKSSELPIDNIISLVGHKYSDDDIYNGEYSKIFDELIKPKEKFIREDGFYGSINFSGGYFLTNYEKGISLEYDSHSTLMFVWFDSGMSEYGTKTKYKKYEGELPLKLKFSYDMKKVDELFGSTMITDYNLHQQCYRMILKKKEVIIYYDSENQYIKTIGVTKDSRCQLRV